MGPRFVWRDKQAPGHNEFVNAIKLDFNLNTMESHRRVIISGVS